MPVLAFLRRLASKWNVLQVKHLVTCPENQRPAGVNLDILHGMSSCTRWPEKAGCGQECLSQIHAAPHDCRVRTILERWYEDKACVLCRQPFGEIHWSARKPALLRADKSTAEWEQIPVEQLPDTLASSRPICFACHLASTLVREYPDLVIDRQRSKS